MTIDVAIHAVGFVGHLPESPIHSISDTARWVAVYRPGNPNGRMRCSVIRLPNDICRKFFRRKRFRRSLGAGTSGSTSVAHGFAKSVAHCDGLL